MPPADLEHIHNRLNKFEASIEILHHDLKNQAEAVQEISQTLKKMVDLQTKTHLLEQRIGDAMITNTDEHKRLHQRIDEAEKKIGDLWSVWVWIARTVGGALILALLGLVLVKV